MAGAVAVALVLAWPAAGSAGDNPVTIKPAQRCAALEAQFDALLPAHPVSRHTAAAEKLRAEGGRLCAAKRYATGERKIAAALREIDEDARF